MNRTRAACSLLVLAAVACSDSTDVQQPVPSNLEAIAGDEQSGIVGTPLPDSLRVLVTDANGNALPGVSVTWSVVSGDGQVSPTTSTTNSIGIASAEFTLGPNEGDQQAQAEAGVLTGPVIFTAHALVQPLVAANVEGVSGSGQTGAPGTPLLDSLRIRVTDASGHNVPGVPVNWSVVTGGGSISPSSSTTNGSGVAAAEFTLGPAEGEQAAQAEVAGLNGSPVSFSAIAIVPSGAVTLQVAGGGNNVPERYSSDLWVHGNYAYTGTWGFRDELGDVLKVWSLSPSGAPALAGAVTVPDIGTVSDVQVSEDGQLLVLSGERGFEGGIYTYSLSDPANPTPLGSALIGPAGVHTVTLSTINGRTYAFAALNPGFSGNQTEDQPALLIYDVTQPATPVLVNRTPIEPHYGIHDTFVRDGLAFVFAWDEGVIVYDVGNGIRGGSPASPVEVSRVVTSGTSRTGIAAHNGWWFHNPVTGERRYLFVGQEGPGVIGSQSSGDIHVVDVSDLANPREVAFFHLNGAGTHNFWMDEARQILYAAYYNGGVVALDVSGTLSGDLSGRLLSQIRPGGPRNTYTWGVQLANGSLYAIDMLSGLWQLKTE